LTKKTKVLWCGDIVAMTGFARVTENVISRLKDDFEIVVLGNNWWGDPTPLQQEYKMYPSSNRHQTAPFGEQRIREIVEREQPDVVFTINDMWIINEQYNQIKARHPEAMLLFRVGDFYETFGQDAVKASRFLGIILTKIKNGAAADMELAESDEWDAEFLEAMAVAIDDSMVAHSQTTAARRSQHSAPCSADSVVSGTLPEHRGQARQCHLPVAQPMCSVCAMASCVRSDKGQITSQKTVARVKRCRLRRHNHRHCDCYRHLDSSYL
jgi:hypothetical protein